MMRPSMLETGLESLRIISTGKIPIYGFLNSAKRIIRMQQGNIRKKNTCAFICNRKYTGRIMERKSSPADIYHLKGIAEASTEHYAVFNDLTWEIGEVGKLRESAIACRKKGRYLPKQVSCRSRNC